MKTIALRTIPVLGWIYIGLGLLAAGTGRGPRGPIPRALWWIDVFLSVVVHAAQIPAALRAADGTGRSPVRTAVLTQIFGLTWWRTQTEGNAR